MIITIKIIDGVSEVVTDKPLSTTELVGHLSAAIHGVLCSRQVASTDMAGLPTDIIAKVRREIDTIMRKVREDYPRRGGGEGGPVSGS